MTYSERVRQMVESPCTEICTLDFFDVCRGCQRTRDEIGAWSKMTDTEKLKVIERIQIERCIGI